MCHHVKFHHSRPNNFGDITIFRFLRWPLFAILDFHIFKFFATIWVEKANVHRHTKFYQNRSNRCWNIAIYPFFQDDGKSTILDLWGKFWDNPLRVLGCLYLCAKFVRTLYLSQPNWILPWCFAAKFGWNRFSSFDNTKVGIFCVFGLKSPIYGFFWDWR